MSIITIFHKKFSFSFLALLSLLLVVSISFGTISSSASSTGSRKIQAEKPSFIDLQNKQTVNNLSETKRFSFLTNNITSFFSGNGIGQTVAANSIANGLSYSSLSPDSIFTVNNNGDTNDSAPGDGVCSDSSGNCTLRAAIQQANATAGTDEIAFNLTTPTTIQLNSTGGLFITEPVTINGPGARLLTISGNSNTVTGIFRISYTAAAAATISGLTVAGSDGNGINNEARLNLRDVSVKGNRYGIYNTGRLDLNRLTVNNNSSGGIYIGSASVVNIYNTTITNNTSTEHGGGIHSLSSDVTLNNVTISHNTASTSGGGIYYSGQTSGIYVRNTIIADNTAPVTTGPDIFSFNSVNGAVFTSRGNNLIGKSAANTGFVHNTNGDKVGTVVAPINPLLGPLQNNGGQTDTRALLSGSPAKDAGNSCVTNSNCGGVNPPTALLLSDQRGTDFPRNYESGVDVGAFESFYPVPSINSLNPNNWGTGRGAFELVITGSNFVAGAIVKWNGQNRVTTFVSNTQLKAQILASDVQTAGQYSVTVANPQPSVAPSEPVSFTVADCSFSLNPISQLFTAAGGNGTVNVMTPNGCTWSPVSTVSWIAISPIVPPNGKGPGMFSFSVAANTGAARTGTIIVNGQTFTVNQAPGCTYSLSSSTLDAPGGGTTGSVNITTQSGCPWTAASNASWITVTSGSNGTGNGTINFTVAANTGQARFGTITIGGQTFSVNQSSGCAFSLSPTSANPPSGGGTSTFNINSGCAWTAVSNALWITITAGSSGAGNGTVTFSVAANPGSARTGTITAGGQTFTVNQAPGCTYSLSSVSANSPASGLTGSVNVTANTGCAWTAASNASWITVTAGASGSGNGTVQFTVAANTGPARTGTITIAGQTFTVTQDSGCIYTLSPTSANVPSGSSTNSFNINSGAGCTWTTASNASWITVTAGASGSGNGTVQYAVAANTGPARTGTITAGGQTFTVNQANGCTFSINPSNQSFTPAAGSGSFALTASNSDCTWTAASNASWITVNNTAGTGNGTVTFSVAANTGTARTGTITAGGQTFTVNQATGCTFTLTPNFANFEPVGGSGSFNVTTNNVGCTWTAATTDSWITINNGTGTGNGVVSFTVQANINPARTGTITVGGQTFTVNQSNGCVFTLSPTSANVPSGSSTNSFNINSGANCAWTAISNASWITVTSGSSGTGSSVINYTVAANIGPARAGTITVGGQTFTVNQANGCVFTLSSNSTNSPSSGSTGSVNVTAITGCMWTANSNFPWIAVTSGSTGNGNGTVQFTVAANTGPERTGTITIAGQTFTVTQANGCVYTLTTISTNINESGGTANFQISSGAGCTWTAVSNVPWITITSGAVGNGVGTVEFSVQSNLGGVDRDGTITAAGGQTFTVRQVSLTVRNFNDSGLGSLRQAVMNANNSPGNDVITFQLPNPGIITLTTGEITIAANGTLEIRGPGPEVLHISGNNTSRIFYINQANVTISGVTLTKGNGVGADSVNNYKVGGAVYVEQGALALNRVQVSFNTISVPNTPESRSIGGGVYYLGGANHQIKNSTFSSNKCIFGAGYYSQGNVAIENSTFSLNTAEKAGGGIYSIGDTVLRNVTITGNSSDGSSISGAGIMSEGGRLNPANTIIAGNNGPEITFTAGQFLSEGNNLIGDSSGDSTNTSRPLAYNPSDIRDTPPMLSPLGLYGGTIPTVALLVNSPAINVGNNTNAPSMATDQRGSPRVMSGTIDIGAFEHNIGISPSGPGLPNGTVGGYFSQELKASRIDGTDPLEPFKYFVVDGFLPGGLQLSQEGHIYGNATTAGVYTFIVKTFGTNDTNEIAGVNKYTIAVGCTYSINPMSLLVNQAGGNGTVNLTTLPGCTWTAVSNVPWVAVTNNPANSRVGSGEVTFSVQPNTGINRTGTITIGGQTFTVTQTNGCVYTLSSTVTNAPAAGGTGSFNINSATGCPWTSASNASWIAVTGGNTGTGNAAVNFSMQANTGVARTGTITAGGQTYTVNQADGIVNDPSPALFDFDGDGKTDLSIFRPSVGEWWYLKSSNGGNGAFQFGTNTDKLVPADYTGDGKTDIAFFRPSTGEWFILRSEDFSFYSFPFGTSGDVPAPADYDGDGKADAAVFRPSNLTWYINRSSGGTTIQQFGASGDVPTVADYDGDGKADIAIYRPSAGQWWLLRSNLGAIAYQFGASTDKPVQGDYTGDGKVDAAFFRPSTNEWFILRSENDSFYSFPFGAANDIPSPGDYDGDGKFDAAIFRPSNNTWFVQRSSSGTLIQTFGQTGDISVPNAFVP